MASPDVEPRRFSDVMHGHRPLRDPRAPRKSPRRTSDGSGSSPRERERIPVLEQKRNYSRLLKGKRSDRPVRRASDTALLPPIRVSTICHPASPTCDVTADASSPTSNGSSPAGHAAGVGGNAPGSNNHLSLPQAATAASAAAEREARSPINRKDTQSNMSVAETAETNRLSPIAGSDKLRAKAERRVLKSVSDVINDITQSSGNNKAPGRHEGSTPTPKPKLKSKNRSISMQALPKLSPSEEPFSIRRKIEQFRRWHEEQYTEKLKKLKVEGEKDRREKCPPQPEEAPANSVSIDFAKILEENMQNIQKSAKTDKSGVKPTKGAGGSKSEETENRRRAARCKSGATWRTWRDVNDSYAYNDVKKYIEENELLPAERAGWIRDWLSDVERALGTDDEHTGQGGEAPRVDDNT